jgi:hypothetical protein
MRYTVTGECIPNEPTFTLAALSGSFKVVAEQWRSAIHRK